jgi:flagellar biosynthesis GTPase FlhF
MEVVAFVAETPAAALAQIHARLGPEAVVLSVRPVPATGLSRFLGKTRRVEVLAGLERRPPGLRDPELQKHADLEVRAPAQSTRTVPANLPTSRQRPQDLSETQPPHLQNQQQHSGVAPRIPQRHYAFEAGSRPHVFIGPPGVGKTTLLCKWLVSAMLTEQHVTHLWRLDGANANTAEVLNIYAEMFGVPIERFWTNAQGKAELLLVDLPGVEASDAQSMKVLKDQLAGLGTPHVHLVLNAAYDTPILIEQFRAFAGLFPQDLSFTHLDEEKRESKLAAIVASTGCRLGFLSGGQKIPGEFQMAHTPAPISQQTPARPSGFRGESAGRPTWQSFCYPVENR